MKNMNKNKIIVAIDVDGGLRNFEKAFMDAMRRDYPWTIIGETPTQYDFDNINLPAVTKKMLWLQKYPKELFLNSEPKPGVIAEFKVIKTWAELNNIKLICVTSQKPKLIKHTYIWLGKNDFTFDELHVTDNKHEVKCDYLIDYAPKAYKAWCESGRKEENFIMMDSNFNRHLSVTNRIKKLTDIKSIITNKTIDTESPMSRFKTVFNNLTPHNV